jgi:N-methylhydantoinase A/oxoprolinase/acetone carboxylase beta subunit
VKLRLGIDVGGTFTDVVAVDAATRAIVARIKIPTTHDAPEGVAAGIVTGLQRALALPEVAAAEIAFVAHSTTQATNALLEGDVGSVGVVGLHGRFGWLERVHLRVPPIRLGPNASLAARTRFARADRPGAIAAAIDALLRDGVDAVVASEAFGVDRPRHERLAVGCARERGALATAGHEVASTYGLRARTRTAVLNAAILPRMLRTSEMTAGAVERSGIAVPLMIMRSDGGVMDVAEVARRPILTLLSGPAAGLAGALLHENVTDGIFIEVGGTSADCSVIRRGRPQLRPAQIGGHRTMLRTLDVRTLGIAGGSLARADPLGRGPEALRHVGPRSAHIAGLEYACFTPPERFEGARLAFERPQKGDPDDYLTLHLAGGARVALTPTCAANLLGYVPAGDFARGEAASARRAFAIAGAHFGCTGEAFARAILAFAAGKLGAVVAALADEYELARSDIELVGGGGAAAVLVPFAAEHLGLRYRLARDAEVIAPLGVALALVRDVVERTIPAPTPEDVVAVRRQAAERAIAAGAAPEFVEVTVEIDARRSLVRATASGATAAVAGEAARADASPARRAEAAARALHAEALAPQRLAATDGLEVYGIARRRRLDACVVDGRGVVRLVARDAMVRAVDAAALERALRRLVEDATAFGDVGRALPEIALLYGARVTDLGALAESEQVIALAREDARGLEPGAPIVLIAARRPA